MDNGDFCLTKRCPVFAQHCMIGLPLRTTYLTTPADNNSTRRRLHCLPRPADVQVLESTESFFFVPLPTAVYLFACRDTTENNITTDNIIYEWRQITPFGDFDVEYLHSEYEGKLFVVVESGVTYIVRIPGTDRELTPPPLSLFTVTTVSSSTTHIITTKTSSSSSSSKSTDVLSSSPSNNFSSSTTPRRPTTTPPTATAIPAPIHIVVWNTATISCALGLGFVLLVLLIAYLRKIGVACCCVAVSRQYRHRRAVVARQQQHRNSNATVVDVELTSFSDKVMFEEDDDTA